MKFGTVSLGDAAGAILAHSVRAGDQYLKKGTVLDEAALALLEAAGIKSIVAARLETGDVAEDEAAAHIAKVLAGPHTTLSDAFTGRANIFSSVGGVVRIDRARLDALNRIDEAVTVASLRNFEAVEAGAMLATVKIIRFAVSAGALAQVLAQAADRPLVEVVPFQPHRAGLVLTTLPHVKASLIEKSIAGIEHRLQRCGSRLEHHVVCGHDVDDVRSALAQLAVERLSPLLIFGASAIVDRGDVVPRGVVDAGGEVLHLGMPVDPGNLLMLARLGETPVIGVPGCARSPVLNGFDWVLERVLAGLMPEPDEIRALGYGGLLKEIATRPQPRVGARRPAPVRAKPLIGAIVLAAGQSRRMGSRNKLLEPVGGEAMVRRVVANVMQSSAGPVTVVTGHEADKVDAALENLDVRIVHNDDFASGLSSSLAVGLRALPPQTAGALICLGDMPGVSAEHIDRVIAAFDADEGRTICVPVFDGKRGNPVLWGATHFDEMMLVSGDVGARHLIGEHEAEVCEVNFDSAEILSDIDTPWDLENLPTKPASGG